MSDDRREHGMRIRREVLGDDHVDRVMAETTERTAAFQDLITRYAWGEIWARPGLDRKTRSAVTLTALVAHGHFEELAMHVRAARRNGMTPRRSRRSCSSARSTAACRRPTRRSRCWAACCGKRVKTEVGIVGAGPAGLTLARILETEGVESVVVEARSREYCEQRIRAGVIEQRNADLLREIGVGVRLEREGIADDRGQPPSSRASVIAWRSAS